MKTTTPNLGSESMLVGGGRKNELNEEVISCGEFIGNLQSIMVFLAMMIMISSCWDGFVCETNWCCVEWNFAKKGTKSEETRSS